MHRRHHVPLLLVALAVLSGCSPQVSPLYNDYRITAPTSAGAVADTTVYTRIRTALREAGWREAAPAAPNTVTTQPREVRDRLLYRITVSLDVVPLGDRHVRVLFHPRRRYLTGGRSKISYLSGSLRQTLLSGLAGPFAEQGLVPLNTPEERDEEATGEG